MLIQSMFSCLVLALLMALHEGLAVRLIMLLHLVLLAAAEVVGVGGADAPSAAPCDGRQHLAAVRGRHDDR